MIGDETEVGHYDYILLQVRVVMRNMLLSFDESFHINI